MKTKARKRLSKMKIGDWDYYPGFGRFINKAGTEHFLDNRLNKLFHFLLDRELTIVKRAEIIEHVWDEVQVNEENLTKGIFDLRKLLKEKEIGGIKIETIRNIGYRLSVNKKEEVSSSSKSILKLALKCLAYFIMIIGFLILFIRAIRYGS